MIIYSVSKADLKIDIFNLEGRLISTLSEKNLLSGKITLSKNIEDLAAGLYTISAMSRDLQGGRDRIQTIKFIKSR